MNTMQTVSINQQKLTVKEYRGQRVVTLRDIDLCHGRPEGTARRNFNTNKQHLIKETDYYKVCADEIRTHKIMALSPKARDEVTLIAESGYLMLVKSFTDDLAWQIQRQLVNTYFNKPAGENIETAKIQAQQERAHAMLINAQTRMFKTIMAVAKDKNLSPIAAEVFGIAALEQVTGKSIDYRPPCDKLYTATDIGGELGVSANMIGRIANQNGLKTDEYGATVMDKSPYSVKEVPAFRYNEKGKAKLIELILGQEKRAYTPADQSACKL